MTCFVRGALIRTPTGERPIEDLAAGDLVVTVSGPRPIRWIGRRRLDLRRHPQPHLVQPVRIAAHAFAPNEPARDLYLSPRHCIARHSAIIPIEVLIDGVSVTQVDWDEVEYYRLELDEHDVVFAEGLPAESYMYAGLRSALHADYENGEAALTLHPAFASYAPEEDTCLPLAVSGPAVDAVRAELRAVATQARFTGRLRAGMKAGMTRLAGRRRA